MANLAKALQSLLSAQASTNKRLSAHVPPGSSDFRLLPLVKETDIFVFESMSSLFLFKRFQWENAAAKTVYRVSDDIRILRSTHPRLMVSDTKAITSTSCAAWNRETASLWTDWKDGVAFHGDL
ncbi:MAG: hypothetical protein LBS77_02935 [Desulfovibrio sp.]|jgi:hypothetical protein|nr:hypothetical protein [Desulfovibrio sp.]